MAAIPSTVSLFDVDNTLLDNDGLRDDLARHLVAELGQPAGDRYWAILEELRLGLGYVDYLGALQRLRLETLTDPRLLRMSSFLIDYPFAGRVYPGALAALAHARQWGPTAILSDGDSVFQPRKVERSGLWQAVEGRVLIYVHKELMLDDLQRHHPAQHYVMTDDKLHILTAMKAVLGERLTTVFVRQGHYAHDAAAVAAEPPADLTIEAIGDLAQHDLAALRAAAIH